MLGFFGPVAKWLKTKSCVIDNTTFKLHYQVTFVILGASSLLTTGKQFFGEPISCINEGIDKGVFQTYCWIHGTFTLPSQLTGKKGIDHPHPGVGPYPSVDRTLISTNEDGDELRHAWYQWVCFVLVLQAVMCYVPHFLWKSWEGGRMAMLIESLNAPAMMMDPDSAKDRIKNITGYFKKRIGTHIAYAYKFVFCEFLNLVNIIAQMYLMDSFLGGHFTTYGLQVITMSGEADLEGRFDPMTKVFPKMSKCTFHKYGPSGTIQNHDGLCILPTNIIIEKIYILLWFWFLALVVWTGSFLCFRLTTIISGRIRYMLFITKARSNNRSDILMVNDNLGFGDWFVLMQLSKSVNPTVFESLVVDLRDNLDKKRADNLEMRNGTYPTLPLIEKSRASAPHHQ